MALKHRAAPISTSAHDDIREIGGGSTLRILGAGCNSLFSLGLIVVVTRGYSQQLAGSFFAATTLFLLVAQATEVGADEAMVRYIPAFRASGKTRDIRALVLFIIKPVILVSALAALITLGFSGVLGRVLSSHEVSPGVMTASLRLLLPFIPVLALGETLLAATRGFQRMGPTTLIYDIGLAALQTLLPLVALGLFRGSIQWLVVAWVVPYVFVVVAAWRALRRMLNVTISNHELPKSLDARKPVDPSPLDPIVTDYWRFVGPRAVARLAQYGLRRVDVVLVAALAGVRNAAIYTAITRLITVGTIGVQAVQQVAQPKLGELFEVGDRTRARAVFQMSTAWLIAASWPVYLMFAVFSSVLLSAFGHGYARGATALTILCASQLVTVATGPVDVVLVQTGRSSMSLFNQTVALILNVGLCIWLIPKYGIVGAAAARAAALQWNNLAPAFQVRRQTGLHPVSDATTAVAGAAVGCVGVVALVARMLISQRSGAFAVALVVGATAYGATLYRIRELAHFDSLLSGFRRKHPRTESVEAPTPDLDDLFPSRSV